MVGVLKRGLVTLADGWWTPNLPKE